MRVILIGPPGAGKGTQSERIMAEYPLAHISTGDILRENVKNGTELGKSAKSFMDAGKLVPDDVIIRMMKERLAKDDARKGFLLDGFPRTTPQAEALGTLLKELSLPLDAVLLLEISDDEVVNRLCNRRVCSSCGAIYNALSHPPKKDRVCDECGGEVTQRDDDKETVIRSRLSVYHEQTSPLISYYDGKGLLHRVGAAGAPDTALLYIETMKLGV
ncbi:adenylate kinase [Synergistales bacterium]|nr:adenylate kinase [Synergistales bacterium]